MYPYGPPMNPYPSNYDYYPPMVGVGVPFPPGFIPPRNVQQTSVLSVPPVTRQLTDVEKMQQKLISSGLDDKVTTVWVGKISPLVEDDAVKKLLEICGEVKQWARVENNGQLKSFGFCYWNNAEGALRAVRLLDGLQLGDQKLKLTLDGTTTKYLDEYERKKGIFMSKIENDPNSKNLPPFPFALRDEKDVTAKELIEKHVNSINQAIQGEGEGNGVVSKEVRVVREKQAKIERERRDREEEEERKRRQIQEEEERRETRRKEQLEMDYEKLEREWNDYERIMQREKAKYLEDLIERQVKRKRDIVVDDEDDKANRRKIRSRENRRKRQREKEEDERERLHELSLEEAKRNEIRRKLEEEEQRRKEEERQRQRQEQEARWERGSPIRSQLRSPRVISPSTIKPARPEPSSTFVTITLDPNESVRSPNSNSKGFTVALKSNKRTVDATKQLGFSDEPEEDTVVPKKEGIVVPGR